MPSEDLLKALTGSNIEVGSMLNAGVTEALPGLEELMVQLVSGFEGKPGRTGSTVMDMQGNVQDMRVGLNPTESEPEPTLINVVQRIMHEITHPINAREEFFPENVGKQLGAKGINVEDENLDEATATLFEQEKNFPSVAQTRSVAFGGGDADKDMERSLIDALLKILVEQKNAAR